MRIALLMWLESPWSRSIAEELANLGPEVCIAFVTHPREEASTLGQIDDAFREKIREIHPIRSRLPGGLRYIARSRALGQWCKACGCEALVALYGGGFATMAWLSGFRP